MAKKKAVKRKKATKRAKRVVQRTKARRPARAKPAAPPKAGAVISAPVDRSRGAFMWYELLTTDIEGAKRFYPQVTGWTIQQWDKDPTYTMWANRSVPLGGLMVLPAEAKQMGAPPSWMAYVSTPDVDATARKAASMGGRVLNGPFDVPGVGRMGVIQDPQGAVFSIYRPSSPMPGGGEPKVGEFSWHELVTSDYKAAFAFYRILFGWEDMDAVNMGPAGMYQMYGRGGRMLGGMFTKPTDMAAPPAWLYYVRVPSADRAADKVRMAGGKVLSGPMEVPGGDRVAQCMDPQGAMFAVHSRKSA